MILSLICKFVSYPGAIKENNFKSKEEKIKEKTNETAEKVKTIGYKLCGWKFICLIKKNMRYSFSNCCLKKISNKLIVEQSHLMFSLKFIKMKIMKDS